MEQSISEKTKVVTASIVEAPLVVGAAIVEGIEVVASELASGIEAGAHAVLETTDHVVTDVASHAHPVDRDVQTPVVDDSPPIRPIVVVVEAAPAA